MVHLKKTKYYYYPGAEELSSSIPETGYGKGHEFSSGKEYNDFKFETDYNAEKDTLNCYIVAVYEDGCCSINWEEVSE